MKTLFLFFVSLSAHAACELTPAGARHYQSIELGDCGPVGSFCILAKRPNGEVVKDPQESKACTPDGTSCALQGEIFSSSFYQSCSYRGPYCYPEIKFFNVDTRNGSTRLAVCRP